MSTTELAATPMTIAWWTDKFTELYREADKRRRADEFWNAIMAHLSHIGETIRRTNYRELLEAASHAFCWMCGFVGYCNNTTDKVFLLKACLSEIVGLKYPLLCGHCMNNVCRCDSVLMDRTEDKSTRFRQLLGHAKHVNWKQYTIADWTEVFWRIYSIRIHLQHIEAVGFHLLEEAGEEALAIRELVQFRGILSANIEGISEEYLERISSIPGLVEAYSQCLDQLKQVHNAASDKEALSHIRYNDPDPIVIRTRLTKAKMDFVTEFADTFSWFCAVLLKVREMAVDQGILEEFHGFDLLEVMLKEEYCCDPSTEILTCHACGKTICECLFFFEQRPTN